MLFFPPGIKLLFSSKAQSSSDRIMGNSSLILLFFNTLPGAGIIQPDIGQPLSSTTLFQIQICKGRGRSCKASGQAGKARCASIKIMINRYWTGLMQGGKRSIKLFTYFAVLTNRMRYFSQTVEAYSVLEEILLFI